MSNNNACGKYCIKARWPLGVPTKSHSWERWSQFGERKDIEKEYGRLIARGADKRYDFALFYIPTIAERQTASDVCRIVKYLNAEKGDKPEKCFS